MPLRIGEYVLAGEISNTRRNSVLGWVEFTPDLRVRLELTGNFSENWQGLTIRFQRREPDPKAATMTSLPDQIEDLADRQIGVVGRVAILGRDEQVATPESSTVDAKTTDVPPDSRLVMEWHSQNGHVQIDLPEISYEIVATLEHGRSEPESDEELGLAEIEIERRDGEDESDEEDAAADPFGLFGEDLEQQLAESLGVANAEEELESDDTSQSRAQRPWDEVIPGIDEDTKAMYEQWDEIFEGKKDQPVSYLFRTPLKLPKVEDVQSDAEAIPLVKAILAELALLSVALDVCEHFSPRDTYRVLMEEILPTAEVHPNLAASDMVQHYSTSDFCPKCEEELEGIYDIPDDTPDSPPES